MGPVLVTLPLGEGVVALQQDTAGLVALNKPAGVLSHPNPQDKGERVLLQAAYDHERQVFYWKEDGKEQRAWLLNRLDSATSGVMLMALQEDLADHIRVLFQQRRIEKTYQALVFGVPHAAQQQWRDFLAVDKKGGRIRTRTEGNIPSESVMRVLQQWRGQPSLALIELQPKTGRSHQLRVQCASRHLPIVGDATYGDFGLNRAWAKQTGQKRLYLHSLSTRFDYVWKGRSVRFAATAPLPSEFRPS